MELKSILFIGLSNIVSCACNDWIIIEEDGVQDQYFEFLHYAVKRNNMTALEIFDLFSHKTSEQLGATCSLFINAKIYQRMPLVVQFPPPSNLGTTFRGKEKPVYSFRPLKLHLGQILELQIPVFPCRTHETKTYWMTHAVLAKGMFLLQEVDDGQAVSFIGRGIQVFKMDEYFPQGALLDAYFWYMFLRLPRNKMTRTNAFASSASFRLCCLVHAARQKTRPQNESFTMNYANSDPDRKDHPSLIVGQPDTLKVIDTNTMKTVACAVNGKNREFHISPDSEDSNALFVLEEADLIDGNKVLIVAARVYGIDYPERSALYFH